MQNTNLLLLMCVCVCVCVCERERERESVCVCVCKQYTRADYIMSNEECADQKFLRQFMVTSCRLITPLV